MPNRWARGLTAEYPSLTIKPLPQTPGFAENARTTLSLSARFRPPGPRASLTVHARRGPIRCLATIIAFLALQVPSPNGLACQLLAQAPQREERYAREARSTFAESFRTDVPRRPWDIILGNPTGTSVTASVLAYSQVEGYFEFGRQPGQYVARSELVQFEAGVPEEVLLGGLEPNAQYFYRFRSRAGPEAAFEASGAFAFRSGRRPGESFVFTVQSDSHLDDRTDPRIYEATLRNARAADPDFHIDLGDTFMTDKRRSDYRDTLPQYLAQRYYLGMIGPVAPVFLVSGNHDGEGRRRGGMGAWARAQRDMFFATPSDGAADRGNYYSWVWGDALFVVLDPFWATPRTGRRGDYWVRTLGEEQFRWLERMLRSSGARFKFVFIHHLVGGINQAARGGAAAARLFEWGGHGLDGTYEFDARRPNWGKPIHRTLVETGVNIVFHGHDHAFAREELDGVVYLLVPQPGLNRYAAPREVGSTYMNGDVVGGPGHVRVSVTTGAAMVELVQSRPEGGEAGNGRTTYSFRVQPR